MHQLQRGQAPGCLKNYKHGINNWADVTPADKADIWVALEAMQGQRCAYCEISISQTNRHIEHFRQRGRDPTVTFDWTNLFGSCNREESCGKHKDGCGTYPPTVLIKPDIEDPERFLVFAPDGGVSPRASLSQGDKQRAEETIRIFNLNGPLRRIRYSHIATYIQDLEQFAELYEQNADEDWQQLLLDELQQRVNQTSHLPFATAIKHILTRQG